MTDWRVEEGAKMVGKLMTDAKDCRTIVVRERESESAVGAEEEVWSPSRVCSFANDFNFHKNI